MHRRTRERKPTSEHRTKPRHDTPGSAPERRCIASGQSRPVTQLIRFVVGPDDRIVADVAGKLPGRGIWICAGRDLIARAVDKRLFARAAKQQVTADPDLPDQVEGLLVKSCLGLIGLARRAGDVVTGFDQVKAMLAAGEAGAVLRASDAAQHGAKKIDAGLKRTDTAVPVIALFGRTELSLALGRENVVHAALRSGGLTSKFVAECVRLDGFRTSGPEAVEIQSR